jgi:hypothetical protein
LYQKIFEGPEVKAWKEGTSQLTLHLDSLDEALLRIDSIASLLAAEIPRLPTKRLYLRIACRTAVWPALTLEPALEQIWEKDSVGVFELAPLRRIDAITAAQDRDIDVEAFFEALFSTNAVPFAIKPLTLNLLLNLFKRDGRLPNSLIELYKNGCLILREERSPSRHDSLRTGKLNANQRLRLAGRIAAVTMLANRYAIWTGRETDMTGTEDLSLAKLASGSENRGTERFDVSNVEIREVLDTGLFTSRGISRMEWAHQSYAEFLTALYLIECGVSIENILRIFRHPSGGLIPQLAVTASWAASLNTEIRNELIKTEPIVALRGDLASWGFADRERLTESLLIAFDTGQADDFVPGFSFSHAYSKLLHPNLTAQLRTYIADTKKTEIARRAALRIAEACKLKELQQDYAETQVRQGITEQEK